MEVVGVPQVLEKHVLRNEEPRWMPVPLRPRQGMGNLPPDPFQKRKTELKSFVKGKTAVRVRHQKMQFFEYSKMKVTFPIGSISQFGRENQIPEAFKIVPSFVRPWNPFYLLEQFPATRDGIERSFPKIRLQLMEAPVHVHGLRGLSCILVVSRWGTPEDHQQRQETKGHHTYIHCTGTPLRRITPFVERATSRLPCLWETS